MRSLAAAATALFVSASLLSACVSADRPRPDVALLPAPGGASTHVWHWTGECPFAPTASEGCEREGPILGFAQLNGDEWNLSGPANAGSLDMSVDSNGSLRIGGHFVRTAPCTEPACLARSAFTWVRGYPSVLYGINQCHGSSSPPESPRLPLPMRLDSIPPHLIGVTAYSVQATRVTYDVAYDLWLNDTGTKQPCRSEGTLEIMVWTDYDTRALLPASMQAGMASIPYAVDRTAHPGTQAWSIYASNIDRNGRTAPWGGTVWFVLNRADRVGHGLVSVDLTAVLSAAGLLLRDNYGWPELGRHYWLDTVPFGVEFGPASGDPLDPGPSRFSAQISAYCLDVRTTLPDAPCE